MVGKMAWTMRYWMVVGSKGAGKIWYGHFLHVYTADECNFSLIFLYHNFSSCPCRSGICHILELYNPHIDHIFFAYLRSLTALVVLVLGMLLTC